MARRAVENRRIGRGVFVALVIAAFALAWAGDAGADKTAGKNTAPSTSDKSLSASDADSSMTLRAGQSGTQFRSMTIEGEDRVHVEFKRPELNLDLDPQEVPGLTRGTAMDVLDRTVPDLAKPMVAMSSQERSPYIARPWLRQFGTGAVARFRPAVRGVVKWKLLVADSRGETVASFDGVGDPPKEIAWDGRTKSGAPVTPGLTYSYVFEAHDKAGNKRNFVGQGFAVSAYRVERPEGQALVMSGRDLVSSEGAYSGFGTSARLASKETPPIFLEVASWLNQSTKVREPVRVAVSARTMDQATTLANRALTALSGRVIGEPARIQAVREVAADAPEEGVLRIGTVK